MTREELDKIIAQNVIDVAAGAEPKEVIMEHIEEVCNHLFTITDDELTILDQGLKILVALDPLFVNCSEQEKYKECIKMMQEIIDLIWKEKEC